MSRIDVPAVAYPGSWCAGRVITMAAPNRNYKLKKKNHSHLSNLIYSWLSNFKFY